MAPGSGCNSGAGVGGTAATSPDEGADAGGAEGLAFFGLATGLGVVTTTAGSSTVAGAGSAD
jgi:hypothetical protein